MHRVKVPNTRALLSRLGGRMCCREGIIYDVIVFNHLREKNRGKLAVVVSYNFFSCSRTQVLEKIKQDGAELCQAQHNLSLIIFPKIS